MAERDYIITTVSPYQSPGNSIGSERSSEEIRQNIAATRESITETVDELSSRVQRTFDWKTYVADYPLAVTGAAAGLGLLLGYLVRSRVSPGERIHEALAELVEETAHNFQNRLTGLGHPRPGLGTAVRAAAITTLAQAAGDLARNRFGEKDRQ